MTYGDQVEMLFGSVVGRELLDATAKRAERRARWHYQQRLIGLRFQVAEQYPSLNPGARKMLMAGLRAMQREAGEGAS